MLDENEKLAKARLAAVQVKILSQYFSNVWVIKNNIYNILCNIKCNRRIIYFLQVYVDDVEKDAKATKALKQAQTKKCLERLQTIQKDLQASVSEVNNITTTTTTTTISMFMHH